MANIKVKIDYPIADGTKLRFRTPCESTSVDGLVVTYPVKDGVGYAVKTFTFADANGNELSGLGNVFTSDVLIGVLLDVTKGRAYIKNADTNSYIEDIKKNVKRLEEERTKIFADAGREVEKMVEQCKNAVNKMIEEKQAHFTEMEKSVEECDGATEKANEAAKTLGLSAKEIRESGFVESLKETNNGDKFTFWAGTKEEYEAEKETIPANTLCVITDETIDEELLDAVLLAQNVASSANETANAATNAATEASGVAANASEVANGAVETANSAMEIANAMKGVKLGHPPIEHDVMKFDYFVAYKQNNTGITDIMVFDHVTKDEHGLALTAECHRACFERAGVEDIHRLYFWWDQDGYKVDCIYVYREAADGTPTSSSSNDVWDAIYGFKYPGLSYDGG